MNNDVSAKVCQVVCTVFGVDPCAISLDSKAFDIPGWDSLSHLSFCSVLEEAFKIKFTVRELGEIDGVRAIVSLIEAKTLMAA